MALFILKNYFRVLAASWATFGFGRELLARLLVDPLFGLFTFTTFFLDNIFFPEFRRIKINKPIFIIGHPRSGTTFLHRLLTQTQEFVVFEFWHILFPSLVARKIVGPFIRSLTRRGKDIVFPKEVGHEITLSSVEEEEVLFVHQLNTQFIGCVGTSLGFGDTGFLDLVYADQQAPTVRRKTMAFFKQCLMRQAYYLGRTQVITKMNYSGMRLQSLLSAFPDAKIVYLVRSPYETIPSHLSLDRNAINHKWGLKNIPPERLERYFRFRYDYDIRFYRYIEDLIETGKLNRSNCITISYDSLKNDLGNAIADFLNFTGLEPSKELRAQIAQQIQKQASYRPKHRNLDLGSFGLTKERIATDLAFVFDKYGFPK